MNNRIKELRKKLKLTQANFGKQIGLKATAIGMYESGDRNITEQTIKLICREFNVNESWLRTGSGEMFDKKNIFSFDEFLQEKEATELEIDIMKMYLSLDKDTRTKIMSSFKTAVLKDIKKTTPISSTKSQIIRVPARGGHYDIEETQESREAFKKDLESEYEHNPDDF